jgi:hypothetical protein
MKIRKYVYQIQPGPDHDRLQSALLDRANALHCQCTRSVIGASLASGSAFLFEGIVPEPGCELAPELEAQNMCLEALRDTLFLDMQTI